MLVLHPFAPGVRPADQAPCWEALVPLRRSNWAAVVDVACVGPLDYADAIEAHGSQFAPLMIVEHDMAPTYRQVLELALCEHDWCAMDYGCAGRGPWSTWADHSLLGLCRICPRALGRVPARPKVPRVPWGDLAYELTQRLGPAHLHPGLVDHHHGVE